MQDPPSAADLLAAVAAFLRDTAAPQLEGHAAFEARVAASAVDTVRRELGADTDAAERARLAALTGEDGDLATLTRRLAEMIAAGEVGLETPGLVDHLWQTTNDKLAIDQPKFAARARGQGA